MTSTTIKTPTKNDATDILELCAFMVDYLNQFLSFMVLNYSNNEKAEIKESQLREESAACHLLFILSTIAEGRDLNHMSARARAGGEARQLRL